MEVEILSKETIKASISIPDHLPKTLNLSLLDQLSPLTYTPLIFFYSTNDPSSYNINSISSKLKHSLSETLTHFYFLAGKIKNNSIIDCSDQEGGALFLEAKISSVKMSEFLKNPKFELMDQLLPFQHQMCKNPKEVSIQVAAQLNMFSCGGIAISVCFLHKIIDGNTLSTFLKSWANDAISGSFDKQMCADYLAVSSLFPQRELSFENSNWLSKDSPFISKEKSSRTRRFVFEAQSISILKVKARSKSVPNPSCVEVVTGFIWKFAMKAATVRSGSRRPSVLTHAVNLRNRMEPPLSEFCAGNIFWRALAYYHESKSHDVQLDELVSLLRKSFEEINGDYIEKMKGDDGFRVISNSIEEMVGLYSEKPWSYGFSSWKNMGLNEVNFGWGKPIWVSTGGIANSRLRNVVLLIENNSGDGIEAWISLDEEEMYLLENDQEFLSFTSLNPSIYI